MEVHLFRLAYFHHVIALLAIPVASLGDCAIPTTKLPHIALGRPRQQNKFTPYRHSTALQPQHHSIIPIR